jgi:hypothetical protein
VKRERAGRGIEWFAYACPALSFKGGWGYFNYTLYLLKIKAIL